MSYNGSKAAVELGSTVSIGPLASATGSPTYTAIAEVIDVAFSGQKVAVVDVTNMSSTAHEKLGTLPDYGQIKLTLNRVPTDAGQIALAAAFASAGTYLFEVQEPVVAQWGQTTAGNLWKLSAIVTEGPDFTLSPTAETKVTYTLEVTGTPALTAGS